MNNLEKFLCVIVMILVITLILVIVWPNCDNNNYMWLKVLEKNIDKYGVSCWVVLMSEDNQIITTTSFEVYHLVKVGDVINANVKFDQEVVGIKFYNLSNIEFIK